MTYRFHNHESAALAAAKLRSEGYYAEVADETVSTFWGSPTVGGVRVIASSKPICEESIEVEENRTAEFALRVCRAIVICLLMICFMVSVGYVLYRAWIAPFAFLRGVGIAAVSSVILLLVAAGGAILLQRFFSNSIIRNPDQKFGIRDRLLSLLVIYLVIQILLVSL